MLTHQPLSAVQFPTLGIATGYIFGGIVGLDYGWRIPFYVQVRAEHS